MQKKCIFVLPSKSKKYFIMEQRNNKQDLIIFEIENLLNKMSNQVNFLIRKEMTMNQLDVDLLMENTRKLYDTICSIELGGNADSDSDTDTDTDVDSELIDSSTDRLIDSDANSDADSELIDSSTDGLIDFVPVPVLVPKEEVEGEEDIVPEENPIPEKEADIIWDFTIEDKDTDSDTDSELIDSSTDRLIDSDSDADTDTDSDSDSDSDADSELIDSSTDGLIDSSTDELIDSSTDGLIDSDKEEDSVPSPITNIYSAQTEEVSGIRTYKIVRENAPTISDKLEQSVDNSIAARMQRKPVSDLISAIDINDKFLFLNELFGGSMDKYNKSIRSLNSFSTLLGAKTYMSELQIEFQWDCNSDAYKKLADLVERRFI